MAWTDDIRGKDDQSLWDEAGRLAMAQAGGDLTGTVMQKKVDIVLTELSVRSHRALRESIEAFRESNDRYSQRLVRLTCALIGLTIVLAVLAVPPAVGVIAEWKKSPKRTVESRTAQSPQQALGDDPLGLYRSNRSLRGCLVGNNPTDPLGLI